MDEVKFKDNHEQVINAINETAIKWLEEAKDSVASQVSRNSAVDTGALKASFQTDSFVDEEELTAYVGSSLEYAIYQEYGTGEYALNGDGRKGGWAYKDPKTGETVFTHGNRPRRMLYHAFLQKRKGLINSANALFKARFK